MTPATPPVFAVSFPATPTPLVLALWPYTPFEEPDVALDIPITPLPPVVALSRPNTAFPVGSELCPYTPVVPPLTAVAIPAIAACVPGTVACIPRVPAPTTSTFAFGVLVPTPTLPPV